VVERGSLENCWRRKALVGSNPTPSAESKLRPYWNLSYWVPLIPEPSAAGYCSEDSGYDAPMIDDAVIEDAGRRLAEAAGSPARVMLFGSKGTRRGSR
jgi:hypothetical protein